MSDNTIERRACEKQHERFTDCISSSLPAEQWCDACFVHACDVEIVMPSDDFAALTGRLAQLARGSATFVCADRPESVPTFGDHWISKTSDGLVIFGWCYPLDVVETNERAAGASESDVRHVLQSVTAEHENGWLYGRAYSVVCPSGEAGDTHVSQAVKLDKQMFEQAADAGWSLTKLVDDGQEWAVGVAAAYGITGRIEGGE